MIYGFRHLPGDDHWCLEVERYHLLPQVGLVLIVTPLLLRAFQRLDRRPTRGLLAITLLSLVLLVSHRGSLRAIARFYDFPDTTAHTGGTRPPH